MFTAILASLTGLLCGLWLQDVTASTLGLAPFACTSLGLLLGLVILEMKEQKKENLKTKESLDKHSDILKKTRDELLETRSHLALMTARADEIGSLLEHDKHTYYRFFMNTTNAMRHSLAKITALCRALNNTVSDEKQKKMLRQLMENTADLSLMLGNTLNFVKVEAGAWTEETDVFSIKDALRDISEKIALKTGDSSTIKIKTDADVPDIIRGDSSAFKQIFAGILLSSTTTNTSSNIEISIKLEREEEDKVWLYCEIIEKQKFKSTDTHTQTESIEEFDAVKLASEISKKLIQRIGGWLMLEERPSNIHAITFLLPVIKANEKDIPNDELYTTDTYTEVVPTVSMSKK